MAFAPKPTHSKGTLNRAGKALVRGETSRKVQKESLKIVNDWRTCHAYPLNTFNSTLRSKLKNYPDAFVAQRLKRLPTIVDKLERFPDMNLSQMQDIGGIRAVVDKVESVQTLQAQYKDTKRFTHILKKEHDYILSPKKDGYRGVHLIFEYNNTLSRNGLAEDYSGLLIELQIRTALQHVWATAVETTGTLVGESFKTGAGSKGWKEFFALVSSAFAIVESSPVVERHQKMTPNEIFLKIKLLEKRLGVIDHIKGLSAAATAIHDNRAGFYNIIVLDTLNKKWSIFTFTENELEAATKVYARMEASQEKGRDQVLVRAGDLKSLKTAYPNYFLDVREFIEKLIVIIEEAKE